MTSTTESNDPTTVELCQRLDELATAVTKGRDRVLREFTMCIPAKPKRDADLVLSAAARRLRKVGAALGAIAAAEALVEKLDEIIAHPDFAMVFDVSYIHGCPYNGPNFEHELKALREELDQCQDQ